jgi:hypothetical protein
MQSVSKSPKQDLKASASGPVQPSVKKRNLGADEKSQNSRQDDLQVSNLRQRASETNPKEPGSGQMIQQTPRLGNDEMKNQASGKKGSQYQRLSLKKME